MGSFLGHVVPGSFFSLFGLWWLYNVFYRYFYAMKFSSSEDYRSKSCFQYSNDCRSTKKLPLESLFKILAISIGMLGELITGYDNEGHFVHLSNAQHMTMFFFFGFNGLVDLAYERKIKIPPHLDYVTAIIGFGVEGFLFFNHLHGRAHMDIQVHMFLVYIIVGCIVFTILEMIRPKEVIFALGRTYCTIFQGTWFFQIGFILYPPSGNVWDQDSHTQMMLVTLIFTWHIGVLLLAFTLTGYLIWLRVKLLNGQSPQYHLVDASENKNGSKNGLKRLNSHSLSMIDSGDEDESLGEA